MVRDKQLGIAYLLTAGWKGLAAALGLSYREVARCFTEAGFEVSSPTPFLEGNYRKHGVQMFVEARPERTTRGRGNYVPYTICLVRLVNPTRMWISLHEERLHRRIARKYLLRAKEISVNDGRFERRFTVQGYSPIDIRTALDWSVRERMRGIRSFNFAIDEVDPCVARCEQKEYIRSSERLRSILDTMIDIAENIDGLATNTATPAGSNSD